MATRTQLLLVMLAALRTFIPLRNNPYVGLVLLFGTAWLACGDTYYISQTATGNGSGSSSGNRMSVSNYNATVPAGSGDIVSIGGTITSHLDSGHGGSFGSRLAIVGESGSRFSAPTWTGSVITGYGHMVFDGIVVEATDNGTSMGNQNNFTAMNFSGASDVVIKNASLTNLYVRVAGFDSNEYGFGIQFFNTFHEILITNVICNNARTGIQFVYGPGCSNVLVTYYTAYNCNWGGASGDAGSSSRLVGMTLDHATIYNFQNWEDPPDQFHHNGWYFFAENAGVMSNVVISACHIGPGYASHNTSGIFISGHVLGWKFVNNIFDGSDNSSPADAMLTAGTSGSDVPTVCGIYNNTFVKGSGTQQSVACSTSQIFINCTNNEYYQPNIAQDWTFTVNYTFASDYNHYDGWQRPDFMGSGTDGSTGTHTFSQWQGFGFEAHSTTNNALLDANFAPMAGSPLIGAGVNLAAFGVTNDYFGNLRPNPPSIGYAEYISSGSGSSMTVGKIYNVY